MKQMLRYLLKRLAFMGLTILAVCALNFFLMKYNTGRDC
jgi:ABC-type microcin C transport system permease subunit YejB